MLSCLTACGGGGASTASGENSAAAEETKQVEKTSAKSGSGDRVFERDLTRTIPEGYEELDWFDEKDKVPVKVIEIDDQGRINLTMKDLVENNSEENKDENSSEENTEALSSEEKIEE